MPGDIRTDEIRKLSIGTIIVFIFSFYLLPGNFLAITSIFITIFFGMVFLFALGGRIPLKEIILLITAFQLLLASYMAYYVIAPDPIFSMEADPSTYFQFAVPAVLAYGIGLSLVKINLDFNRILDEIKKYELAPVGKKLIIIGLIASFIGPWVPRSFHFLLLLISYIGHVGAIYMLLSNDRRKWFWILIGFLPLILNAINSGLFHWLILWIIFGSMFYFFQVKPPLRKKVTLFVVGFLMIFILENVKRHYRAVTWQQGREFSTIERVFLFTGYFFEFGFQPEVASESEVSQRLTRANQGAIITWVMDYVPDYEPFADGETIYNSLESALLPRLLFPNKAMAGGVENFEKFTGRELRGTSINLGIVGEAYANYGYNGIIFMFIMGLFYGWLIKLFFNLCRNRPWLLLWTPFIFLVTIKAEDDLVTALNHMVKSGLVLFLFTRVFLDRWMTALKSE